MNAGEEREAWSIVAAGETNYDPFGILVLTNEYYIISKYRKMGVGSCRNIISEDWVQQGEEKAEVPQLLSMWVMSEHTLKVLLFRNESIILDIWTSNWRILCRRPSCHTEWKALATSRKIAAIELKHITG